MSILNKTQLSHLRNKLLTEKEDIEKRMAQNEHDGLMNSERDATGELSTSDNHPGDLGTDVYERGKDVALHEHAEHQLENINRALNSMSQGIYGDCIVCGVPIPFERLDAVPDTQFCMSHAPTTEQIVHRERPIEEEFMTPPFGRTSLDEHEDLNFFDGEDAWQIVESWGTSNTPAMAEDPNEQSDYNHMFVESDEIDGYVETLESFLATDIYGKHTAIIKNRAYHKYIENNEGDRSLEVGTEFES